MNESNVSGGTTRCRGSSDNAHTECQPRAPVHPGNVDAEPALDKRPGSGHACLLLSSSAWWANRAYSRGRASRASRRPQSSPVPTSAVDCRGCRPVAAAARRSLPRWSPGRRDADSVVEVGECSCARTERAVATVERVLDSRHRLVTESESRSNIPVSTCRRSSPTAGGRRRVRSSRRAVASRRSSVDSRPVFVYRPASVVAALDDGGWWPNPTTSPSRPMNVPGEHYDLDLVGRWSEALWITRWTAMNVAGAGRPVRRRRC